MAATPVPSSSDKRILIPSVGGVGSASADPAIPTSPVARGGVAVDPTAWGKFAGATGGINASRFAGALTTAFNLDAKAAAGLVRGVAARPDSAYAGGNPGEFRTYDLALMASLMR